MAPVCSLAPRGYSKGEYISCTFRVWTDSLARFEEVRQRLLQVIGDQRLRDQMFVVDWNFCNSRGNLISTSFDEIADDLLLEEAYPSLGKPVSEFIDAYLHARETVLILQGPPGTGKTRLVRAILAAMSRRKGDSAKIMYTADKRALENDEIFVDFITGSHDAFVIEDADHLLKAAHQRQLRAASLSRHRRWRGARAEPQGDLHDQPAQHQRHRRCVAAAGAVLRREEPAQPRARGGVAAGGEDLRCGCGGGRACVRRAQCHGREVVLGGAGLPCLRVNGDIPHFS
jgi:hypothetical protein